MALDTTSEHGGVGLFRGAECLALVPNKGPANIFSISLFTLVDQALAQAGLGLHEIDLYAVANGPGSFTGIRVGIAAALAWGKAFDRPVRGVSVLQAMVQKAQPQDDFAFPILDARRGEFYTAAFRHTLQQDGRFIYQSEGDGKVMKATGLANLILEQGLARGTAACLAREYDVTAHGLAHILPRTLRWQTVPNLLVDAIACLAQTQQVSGVPPSELNAYYIRRSDAELNWRG
ncbi:MAG TPA: tRNA (adenosine(37)-N6)-threonylcarbamoyltransferase complex dimerization subunit type 1 TsaB [Terriglobia bacterium]|nr:tRNA (adenosine(37)-N6)-threonylcarbamoyltransferase complex dimerization subunit type 1 TsaB [Terriglobia bacterium]